MKRRQALKLRCLKTQRALKDEAFEWKYRRRSYRVTPKQEKWIEMRLRERARKRMREVLKINPADVPFAWCGHCKTSMIRCPECNNNTCNAGSPCGLCYQYEALVLATRNGKWPTREDFPNADQIEADNDKFWDSLRSQISSD